MLKNKARDLEDGDVFDFTEHRYTDHNVPNSHVVISTNCNDVRVRPLWDTKSEDEPKSFLITGDIGVGFIRSIDIHDESLRHR